jgi:NAD(P)-dependent dehydrogenase (short-subunit alcohol dehydrogenase family)
MDVTDSEAIRAAADLAVRELGGIDIWVNNAGVPSYVPLLDMSDDEWDRVMTVNL